MPNPISCAVNTSAQTPTIDCEPVPITVEPEDLVCIDPEVDDAGATLLVQRFSERTASPVPRSSVRVQVSDEVPADHIVSECSVELSGFALAVMSTPASNVVGVVMGLKTGLDVSKCIVEERAEFIREASIHEMVELCETEGGTALGVTETRSQLILSCEIQRVAP